MTTTSSTNQQLALISLYNHLEDKKNSLYRQVSNMRHSSFFLPKFYPALFFADEKNKYNALNSRQRIGVSISDKEVEEFNAIRFAKKQKTSKPKYVIRKTFKTTPEGISYDDVVLERKKTYGKMLVGLGLFSVFYLQLSRVWLGGVFAPVFFMKFYDRKFAPVEEIDNFYRYVAERRKCDDMFRSNKELTNELNKLENIDVIKKSLLNSNKSMIQAMNDINSDYLNAAKSDI